MADFTEQIEDNKLNIRLNNALSKNKLSQNFKWQIDNSGEHRKEWFKYKKLQHIRFVKKQIDKNEVFEYHHK